jgi:RimJ/RimL family protein N-acetyltransferase
MTADTPRLNQHGQPIGPELSGWRAPTRPSRIALRGRHCRVEPLDPARHGKDLYEAFALDTTGQLWTYLFSGPFTSLNEFMGWLAPRASSADPLFFTIMDAASDRAVGLASYLRIEPLHGVIEIGHLAFSPRLQHSTAATEAMYLLMKNAFDLGYRRYEWKCDSLNAPSRRAAERFGFTFEGIFRQAIVYKGRSRDTAWYSIIDREWPVLNPAYLAWLKPSNFDADGRQRRSLGDCVRAARGTD